MNIPRIPLASLHVGGPNRLTRWGTVAGIAALTWSLSGDLANAQQPRVMQHEGRSFEVVPASEMPGMLSTSEGETIVSDFDQNFPLMQGSQFAAGSCSSGQCGENCGGASCGGGGLRGGGFLGLHRNNCGGPCSDCNPFCYGRIEAVFMRRDGLDGFTRSLSPGLLLDEPDLQAAPRITIGTAPDCVSGYEASFVGSLNSDTNRSVFGAAGRTRLGDTGQPDGIFRLFDDPTTATPDTVQSQRYRSDYWSVEASKTSLAWDIAKLLIGPRYIRFDEQYDYVGSSSEATVIQSGSISSRAKNDLFGLQVGADIFKPLCQSTSAYFRGRAGGYYNNADSNTYVSNSVLPLAGPPVNLTRYGGRDDHGGFSAMFELGAGLQFQVSEMFSIQGGGELWYLTQVATAEDQIPSEVGLGTSYHGTRASDDIFFAGFNIGATMKY